MAFNAAAHGAVQTAVRLGKLAHISECACKECGNQATVYHHYAGYAKENYLKVTPLCNPCHAIAHKGRAGKLKLSDDDVRVARKMRRGGLKIKHIARFFGTGHGFMGKILNGHCYKWVD